ncbi:MAG: hypothetical protein JNL68_11680 [Burkholderiales bacterium]|nr:hypothetical protein [Burkholderiales bacterium]
MATESPTLSSGRGGPPLRVAVVDAAQAEVLETLREAQAFRKPALVGVPQARWRSPGQINGPLVDG